MKLQEQFQIGDRVVYKPEGVITNVIGYVWSTSIDNKPVIRAYELGCGISVSYDDIEGYRGDRGDREIPESKAMSYW